MGHNRSLLGEFWTFLMIKKIWWLTPIIVVLLLASVLIIFSQASTMSSLVYALL